MQILYRGILAFIAIACLVTEIQAQKISPSFDNFSSKDGLAHDQVKNMTQDSNGLMWICTNIGLSKFDGYTFTNYLYDKLDSTSISNDHVWDIFEYTDNTLWIASQGGIDVFDQRSEKFSSLQVIQNNKQEPFHTDTRVFLPLSQDSLLLGTSVGLRMYNFKTKEITPFLAKEVGQSLIRHIRRDKQNRLWISTYKSGLFVYNLNTGKLINYTANMEGKQHVSSNNVLCTLEDSRGTIWLGSESGLEKYDPDQDVFTLLAYDEEKPLGPNRGMVSCMYEDDKGRLWIAFQYALTLYNADKDTFTPFKANPLDPKSIAGNEVWSIYADIKGAIWFGTFNAGLSKLENEKTVFKLYQKEINSKNGLNENGILALQEDAKGGVWIGVDHGGLNYLDSKTGNFSHFMVDPLNPNSISSDAVLSLEVDRKGIVWMGTWGGGMCSYDPENMKFNNYKPNLEKPGSISAMHIWSILEDSRGNLWVGTHEEGLDLFNRQTGVFTPHKCIRQDKTTLSHGLVWDIAEDKQGNIWVATGVGLNKYLPETDSFKRYYADSIGASPVLDIYIDKAGMLWLGTEGRGVIRHNPITDEFHEYSTTNGYPFSTVTSIVQDEKGDFWLGTSDIGLVWFNSEKGVIKTFDKSDGVQGNSFAFGASIELNTGELIIGGTQGLTRFFPNDIKKNEHIPPVLITDFQIFNKPIKIGVDGSPLSKHINYTDTIKLDYSQSVFSIDFAALDFTVPEKNQYAYIMENFEKEWNYVGNKRDATYTNLNPGHYIFHVKASNNDGIWNEEGKSLHIFILPPWWMTWWFRTLVVLSIVVSAISYYYYRMREMKRQNQLLEKQVQERTAELNSANNHLQERQHEILQQNEEIQTINSALDDQNKQLDEKNIQLEGKNDELEQKNNYIEKQKEQISSSIRYAKNIQEAMLPFQARIKQNFDSFIIYKPKDIVSGDFYWYAKEEQVNGTERIVISVADCTGHGVPGAFMSMIGISLLNEIVRVKGIYSPAEILTLMNIGVRKALKQEQTENNDGMDMALCVFDKIDEKSSKVTFAGAKSNIFVYNSLSKELNRIKGSVKKIGGNKAARVESIFENHEFEVQKGDILYLLSDGYVDQNGVDRKRFGSARLQELLLSVIDLPMQQQKERLLFSLTDYQQDAEQRDDITVVGIQVL